VSGPRGLIQYRLHKTVEKCGLSALAIYSRIMAISIEGTTGHMKRGEFIILLGVAMRARTGEVAE
jgi:hypothetical protein